MKLDFYLREQHLGTADLSAAFPTTNLAFFCSDCGTTWGRVRLHGSKTWRMVYRSCGCAAHDALSAFEPGLFELSPYISDPQQWRGWQAAFDKWPPNLLRYELIRLLDNLATPTFYDSLQRH